MSTSTSASTRTTMMPSQAVETASLEVAPRLRGLLHLYTFYAAVACAGTLIVLAPEGRARASAVIYGLALCALFGFSGAYNRWRGCHKVKGVLRCLDHSTIFIFIAASYTPLTLLALSGSLRWALLGGVWLGAFAGVIFSIAWTNAPRALRAGAYCTLGGICAVAIPSLVALLDGVALMLLLAGAALYIVGAGIYAARRPNPWPQTFGFHEVFHALVVAAAIAHLAVLGPLIIAPPL